MDDRRWARWPWHRCRGVYVFTGGSGGRRCDLRRGHSADHVSERGMDKLAWSNSGRQMHDSEVARIRG